MPKKLKVEDTFIRIGKYTTSKGCFATKFQVLRETPMDALVKEVDAMVDHLEFAKIQKRENHGNCCPAGNNKTPTS